MRYERAANIIFNSSQHVFCQGHSTLTQLVQYYEQILQLIETNESVDSVYLDFSKAFDVADHTIIIRKLKALGITGKLGK